MKDQNTIDYHIRSETGIILNSHSIIGISEYTIGSYTQTWAEQKRSELIDKLKTRKANLNKLFVSLLMLVTLASIFCIDFMLSIFIRSEIAGILTGIINAQLLIICFYIFTDKFECNPTYIRVKHKGKTYPQ